MCGDLGSRDGRLAGYVELADGHRLVLHVFHPHTVGPAGCKPIAFLSKGDTLAGTPTVDERVAVDDDTCLVVAGQTHNEFTGCGGCECSFINGREVLKIHTGSENRITTVALTDGFAQQAGGCRRSLHKLIVPISGHHAPSAIRSGKFIEMTLPYLVADIAASLDKPCSGHLASDAFKNGCRADGIAGVVAPKHYGVIGIGAHDGYSQPILG